MPKTFFDAYGELAGNVSTPILISGRNPMHADQVKNIVADVRSKLSPQKEDQLLELGCNIGLLLTPLSSEVQHAVGLDHSSLIDAYEKSGIPNNVRLISGSWPRTQVQGPFDIVLIYGVLNCLPDAKSGHIFISSCYPLLRPGGRLLVGDLPNEDMRQRFLESAEGSQIAQRYSEARATDKKTDESGEYAVRDSLFQPAMTDPFIDDTFILNVIEDARTHNLNAFVLPQPSTLPFGYSREDILIIRPT